MRRAFDIKIVNIHKSFAESSEVNLKYLLIFLPSYNKISKSLHWQSGSTPQLNLNIMPHLHSFFLVQSSNPTEE
jgi:hypothetical protein